jgi:hypothetical protein
MGVSKIMGSTFAFLLCLFGYIHGVNSEIAYFSQTDLWGLQSLWQAWKNNTPNTATNLAFWTSQTGQPGYPCYNGASNWRGVLCMRYLQPDGTGDTTTWVFGL